MRSVMRWNSEAQSSHRSPIKQLQTRPTQPCSQFSTPKPHHILQRGKKWVWKLWRLYHLSEKVIREEHLPHGGVNFGFLWRPSAKKMYNAPWDCCITSLHSLSAFTQITNETDILPIGSWYVSTAQSWVGCMSGCVRASESLALRSTRRVQGVSRKATVNSDKVYCISASKTRQIWTMLNALAYYKSGLQ